MQDAPRLASAERSPVRSSPRLPARATSRLRERRRLAVRTLARQPNHLAPGRERNTGGASAPPRITQRRQTGIGREHHRRLQTACGVSPRSSAIASLVAPLATINTSRARATRRNGWDSLRATASNSRRFSGLNFDLMCRSRDAGFDPAHEPRLHDSETKFGPAPVIFRSSRRARPIASHYVVATPLCTRSGAFPDATTRARRPTCPRPRCPTDNARTTGRRVRRLTGVIQTRCSARRRQALRGPDCRLRLARPQRPPVCARRSLRSGSTRRPKPTPDGARLGRG